MWCQQVHLLFQVPSGVNQKSIIHPIYIFYEISTSPKQVSAGAPARSGVKFKSLSVHTTLLIKHLCSCSSISGERKLDPIISPPHLKLKWTPKGKHSK